MTLAQCTGECHYHEGIRVQCLRRQVGQPFGAFT
jgi:hypothetical protein